MALHPAIERLIVLVAEVQVERALRERKESGLIAVNDEPEVELMKKNNHRSAHNHEERRMALTQTFRGEKQR